MKKGTDAVVISKVSLSSPALPVDFQNVTVIADILGMAPDNIKDGDDDLTCESYTLHFVVAHGGISELTVLVADVD